MNCVYFAVARGTSVKIFTKLHRVMSDSRIGAYYCKNSVTFDFFNLFTSLSSISLNGNSRNWQYILTLVLIFLVLFQFRRNMCYFPP